MNVPQHSTSTRSPVLAILASLVAGAVLAVALLLGPASGASEPMITGSVHVRLRTRLGPDGPPVDPLQRPAADLDGGAGDVPRHHRARPDRVPAGSGRDGPAELGLAPGARRPRRLDVHAGATEPPRPRPLARRPGDRHPPGHRRRRCPRDRQCGHRSHRAVRSRPDDRRGRPPALHRVHGLGQPDRRPPGRPRRDRPPPGRASRRTSRRRPRSAPTTARATDGAKRQPARRTGSPSRPTSTPCSSAPAWPGRTSSSVTPRVDRTSGSSRLAIPIRSRAWCCSTPSRPTRSPRCPITRASIGPYRIVDGAGPVVGPRRPPWAAARAARRSSRARAPLAARVTRSSALPTALQQAQALTTLGDRPLIVVTAGSGQHAGWLAAQDRTGWPLRRTAFTASSPAATHDSLISGVDATASTQAILDVVASVRSGSRSNERAGSVEPWAR